MHHQIIYNKIYLFRTKYLLYDITISYIQREFFIHSKGVFIKKRSKTNKIKGFRGQIKSFRGPHFALGPYVVHHWSRVSKYA